jgi:hypothetical protein
MDAGWRGWNELINIASTGKPRKTGNPALRMMKQVSNFPPCGLALTG